MNRIRIHVLPSSRGRLAQTARTQEPQACSFTQRTCFQPRLEGLEFCIKHVLEDKNAPYRQCSYVSNKNGKRCPNAAPKAYIGGNPLKYINEEVTFCMEHVRRNVKAVQAQLRKASSGPAPEALLSQLSGYNLPETHGPDSGRSEASRNLVAIPGQLALDQTWRGDPDSEADSIDSDNEDPLKRAGVYTAEKVALITREKLIRLQSLYIDQFKRLQHLLKEKKRRYLHSCRVEHETLGISLLTGPEGLSMKEMVNLRKLKALRRYRRQYDVEALLHRQLLERRQTVTEGAPPQAHTVRSSQRCISYVEGTRCSNQCLPMTQHCISHIYQDSNQVLFNVCPGLKDVPCDRPVHMGQSEEPRCPLHLSLPPPMYQPEQETALAPEQLDAVLPRDMYLSAAELQPTESLPLEFSDDLDVVGCPMSPLTFDTALALEDQAVRAIAEAPMDFLTGTKLDASGHMELSERDMEYIEDQIVMEVKGKL
ncbi:hypothetical protein J4Q44_G00216550 [Coregonus suidteri]|uniref:KAT8 regulatory NSL complex subunit 2 n=1 Tax=Coregonus suidteri TaxID=861788 RepID=A0AAN8LF48_9TELE